MTPPEVQMPTQPLAGPVQLMLQAFHITSVMPLAFFGSAQNTSGGV